MTYPDSDAPSPEVLDPADIAGIVLTDIPDEPEAVGVRIIASGHLFMSMVLPRTFIEQWQANNELAGRVMEVMISSHPAAHVINQLMPFLDTLTTIDPAKAMKWKALKAEIHAIADAARAQKQSSSH